MYKAKQDFTISVNGWDNTTFKKGEEITSQELGKRCVELGVAEKTNNNPPLPKTLKPQKNTAKGKPSKTK